MVDQVKITKKGLQGILVYGVDVSDPKNPKLRAMQVDKYGRLVIDPSDLDTRYLKLDGSGAMTGDFNVGAGNRIWFPYGAYGVYLKAIGSSVLALRNYLDNAYADLWLRNFVASQGSFTILQSTSKINDLIMKAGDVNTGFFEVAKLVAHATDYGLEISRAGDITGLAGKTVSFPTITAGNGASDTFTTADGKTVTVTDGIITSIV